MNISKVAGLKGLFPNPFIPATFVLKEIVTSGLFLNDAGLLSQASYI